MTQQSLDLEKLAQELVEALMSLPRDTSGSSSGVAGSNNNSGVAGSNSNINEVDNSRAVTVTTPPEMRSFSCDVCHRSFSSHDALGGHKANSKLCKKLSEEKEKGLNLTQKKTHDCLVCGKSFDKGKALGGHKARHNDKRLVAKKNDLQKIIIKCSVCDKLFDNWQSLGGHKRHHCSSENTKRHKISGDFRASTSEGTTRCSTSRPPLDFDLNEYPPEEKEEEDNMLSSEDREEEIEEPSALSQEFQEENEEHDI